jgi:hypothetical protein
MTTKTKKFLKTRSGLVAASAITLIGPLKWQREHEIDYCNGSEPHSTVATWEAVEEFLGHEYEEQN